MQKEVISPFAVLVLMHCNYYNSKMVVFDTQKKNVKNIDYMGMKTLIDFISKYYTYLCLISLLYSRIHFSRMIVFIDTFKNLQWFFKFKMQLTISKLFAFIIHQNRVKKILIINVNKTTALELSQ